MTRALLMILIGFMPLAQASFWSEIFGPSNYDECILKNLQECGISESYEDAVYRYCNIEFPAKIIESGWLYEGKDYSANRNNDIVTIRNKSGY